MISKRVILPVILILLVSFLFGPPNNCHSENREAIISPEVWQYLDTESFAPIIAFFSESVPSEEISTQENNFSSASTETVVSRLQKVNEEAAQPALPLLGKETARGNIRDYRPLWLINAFAAQVNSEGLERLCKMPTIKTIILDHQRRYLTSDVSAPPQITYGQTAIQEGAFLKKPSEGENDLFNLKAINAPPLWEEGYFGKGIVVAIMDTGVDPAHPDLETSYRGSLPGHSHEDSWFDATGTLPGDMPQDTHGHGTHIAGIILGGTRERPIGVAPEAHWIAVNIFSDGYAWDSHIAQAFQWLLAPGGDPARAPQIINCSWASRPEFAEDLLHWEILYNLEKAGILVVFAAGNNGIEGPGSPASYPHCFSVGALKQTGDDLTIADFSSRGPVNWQDLSYIKPELVAPGVKIVSTWPGNSYSVLDGTSTAAAHLSGAAALLLQAKPELSPSEVKYLFKSTATWHPAWDASGPRPNSVYGYGLLNAYAAAMDEPFSPDELLFFDGAEQGIMNWKTSPENPWKITRELVNNGNFSFADSPWEEYKNNVTSWLALVRPITLEGYHSPILSFQHFYNLCPKGEKKDRAYLDISVDGVNWSCLYYFTGTNEDFENFSLPINCPQGTKSIYFRFRLQSNNNGPGQGWYIDDISLSAVPLPLRALDYLRLTPEKNRIGIGEKINVRAEAIFSTHTLKDIAHEKITWHSTNPSIARIENGIVTGIAPGESIIRGTFYDKTEEFKITIVEVEGAYPQPPPGIYTNAVEVTLLPSTPGTKITYTLDGADPDPNSTAYQYPITIDQTSILKTRAYLDTIPGSILEFPYIIKKGAPVSGTIQLEGKFPSAARETTLNFFSPDTGENYLVTSLAQNGTYGIDLPLGNYTLIAACKRHLTATRDVELSKTGQLSLAPIKLHVGDLNDDNKIDLADLTILSLAYHTRPGDKNWNPLADLNGDGFINNLDLNLLIQNYGMKGDNAPGH
ncbi:MAG TPA: S8 family serine peptidase [Firmicutes bacterium]|nr:S8 family serine peptidase [Bacillota bacterium]